MATAFGRAKKVMEQLEKLSDEEADSIIDGGYISSVREAYQTGILPGQAEFRRLLCLDKCLRQADTVDLPARPASFTASYHFQTGGGLHVWDGFKERVLSATVPLEITLVATVASFDLLKDTADEHIRAELPTDHAFGDASVFCSHLAGMLDSQTGGKDGPLLTNGYGNIFYAQIADEVIAVCVFWFAALREWYVYVYPLDGYSWDAGCRVFSAAAVA